MVAAEQAMRSVGCTWLAALVDGAPSSRVPPPCTLPAAADPGRHLRIAQMLPPSLPRLPHLRGHAAWPGRRAAAQAQEACQAGGRGWGPPGAGSFRKFRNCSPASRLCCRPLTQAALPLARPTFPPGQVNGMATRLPLPLTVKVRLGESASKINVEEVAALLEQAGAAAVTIHGRWGTPPPGSLPGVCILQCPAGRVCGPACIQGRGTATTRPGAEASVCAAGRGPPSSRPAAGPWSSGTRSPPTGG